MEEWGARGLFGNEILTIRQNREVYLVDISTADGVTSMRIERSVFEELLEKIMEKKNISQKGVRVIHTEQGARESCTITKEEMVLFDKFNKNGISFNNMDDCLAYMDRLRGKNNQQERVA